MSRTMMYEYTCHAQIELFTLEFDDLPEEWRDMILEQGSLPCDGEGVPNHWCEDGPCAWCGESASWEE